MFHPAAICSQLPKTGWKKRRDCKNFRFFKGGSSTQGSTEAYKILSQSYSIFWGSWPHLSWVCILTRMLKVLWHSPTLNIFLDWAEGCPAIYHPSRMCSNILLLQSPKGTCVIIWYCECNLLTWWAGLLCLWWADQCNSCPVLAFPHRRPLVAEKC